MFIIFFLVESKGRTKLEINQIYDGLPTHKQTNSIGENEIKKPLKEEVD